MTNTLKYLTLIILLAVACSLIYFIHFQTLLASYYHFWGINFYLNGLKDNGYEFFQRALRIKNPYLYGTRHDFATMIQQGHQVGINFEPIAETHKEGIEQIEKIIAEQPENYFFYNYLAEYYNVFYKFDPSYLDKAEKLSAKAWEISPNRQQILYTMAKTALLKNDEDKGYKFFEQAIALNPAAGDPRFYYGLLALQRGDVKVGLREIEFALAKGRTPKNMQEAILLGNLLGDSGHYKRAVDIYNFALKERKNDPNYQLLSLDIKLKLGIANYYDGNNEEARRVFTELIKEIDLKKFPIYTDLAPILADLGLS